MGRWSRLVAARFVEWLAPRPGSRWVDLGCGTGALSGAVLDRAEPAAVLAVDPSPGYLRYVRERLPDPRLEVTGGVAGALPVSAGTVDYAVCGLVLNFVPDAGAAVADLARVCRSGGTVAGYVWDYAGGMQVLRYFWDAAVELDPGAAGLDESRRFAGCRPPALAALLDGAGLAEVGTGQIVVPTGFAGFEDLWAPFLGGQGPAAGYCAALPDQARDRLRDRLRATLPAAADGTVALTARAWTFRGTAP
jgi:SAM-dependent methyltransferase